MKVCRICLSDDYRLYPISSNGLRSLYHLLTGVLKLETDVEKRLPQWVCAECALRLLSFDKLRQKSLRSYQILIELLDKITIKHINQIDREQNNLQSSLGFGILDRDIIQEYEVDDGDSNGITWKPKLKEDEYDDKINETIDILKPENEDSFGKNECHLDTAVSNKEKNSDGESDSHSDLDNASLSSDATNSLSDFLKLKTSNKKIKVIKKKQDRTTNSLNNKSTKRVKNPRVIEKEPDPIEDIFIVQKLSLEEQLAELEKRRFSRNFTTAKFKCNDCYKGFNTEVTFSRHILMHSDAWGKIECKLCKRRFRTMHTYCRHMLAHRTLYNCKECGFLTNLKSVAQQHQLKHKGNVYKCSHCSAEFTHKTSYMSHMRIKHVSAFVCDICGFSFLSPQGVEQHKYIKHAHDRDSVIVSQDSPTCSTCNIRFASERALNTHMEVFHEQSSDVKKRNDDNGAYGNPKTICELCGVKTSGGRAYSLHISRYHPKNNVHQENRTKPFICEQCGRAFRKNYNLMSHMLVHSGNKPYECDLCDMKFKSKLYVQSHITNLHLPKKTVKVYHCDICGKAFNNPSNRVRHMKYKHSSLRPYVCEICGSSFKTQGDLKAHKTHVHLKKAWPRKKNNRGELEQRP